MKKDTVELAGRFWRTLLRKAVPLLIILAALAAVALLIALLPEKDRSKPAQPVKPVNVKVLVVRPLAEVAHTFDLYGVFQPDRVVTVSAEVDGRVMPPLAERGRRLRAGQEILRLNDDLIRAEVKRDEALFTYHSNQYEQVVLARRRGVATKTQLDQAKMNRDTAEAARDTSRARLARTRVLSPIDGILDDRPVEVGQYIRQGDPVARIVDISKLKVELHVPERDAPYLSIGQQACILPDEALGTATVIGRVTRIREQPDPQARTTLVEVTLPGRPTTQQVGQVARKLRAGPIVTVRLTRRTLRDAVMIPLKAVIPLENSQVVYVAEAGEARQRKIEIDFLMDQGVVLRSGLKAGDWLIVDGHRYVAPGQRVNVVEGAPAGRLAATRPHTRPVPAEDRP